MDLRKQSKLLLALAGQFHQDTPAIVVIDKPPQQSEFGHAANQLDGGVMPDVKEFRQIPDGDGLGTGRPLDGEKRLVLLRGQPGLPGRGLAKRKKLSKLKAKLSESLVIYIMKRSALGMLFVRPGRRLARLAPI